MLHVNAFGEVAEWSKAQLWKCCVLLKGTVGSNPTLSANITKPLQTLAFVRVFPSRRARWITVQDNGCPLVA